jgi:hypothetical protein
LQKAKTPGVQRNPIVPLLCLEFQRISPLLQLRKKQRNKVRDENENVKREETEIGKGDKKNKKKEK